MWAGAQITASEIMKRILSQRVGRRAWTQSVPSAAADGCEVEVLHFVDARSAPEEHHVYSSKSKLFRAPAERNVPCRRRFTCRSYGADQLETASSYKHIAPPEQASLHNKRHFLRQRTR